ncbi:hypothetical protein EYF80_019862 [Liparis tanakae]|uniref:Uncharacterized protein n=1 Tax=Liparis tanakae TaxID=230148 RepID=A0A4Z2HVX3_9TELE|nr:hypothetical protein EYF80_019862 [Liparis tanakae]
MADGQAGYKRHVRTRVNVAVMHPSTAPSPPGLHRCISFSSSAPPGLDSQSISVLIRAVGPQLQISP